MCCRASATNVSSSSFRTGSVTSIIVWRMPRISSGVVLLVPMSMYRYTWRESADTTIGSSPSSSRIRRHRSTDTAVFPAEVGP